MRHQYPQRVAIEVKLWSAALAVGLLATLTGILALMFVRLLLLVKQNHWLVVLIAVIILGLFLKAVWQGFKTLRMTEPALVIDRIGLDSNLGARPWNRITWNEIKAIKGFGFRNGNWLVVHVWRVDRFREMGGPFWRIMRYVDQLVTGSPITINAALLDMPFHEILELAQGYHQAAQQ